MYTQSWVNILYSYSVRRQITRPVIRQASLLKKECPDVVDKQCLVGYVGSALASIAMMLTLLALW